MNNVVIIGSGPAGWTAAIYAARAGLAPVLFTSSVNIGGDLATTTEVENFPGFPEGITGPELMAHMEAQARRFGTEIRYEDVAALDTHGDTKRITLGDGSELYARAVILATGAEYRKLHLPNEAALTGHGVSWCATCDGFFFRDRAVVVVGGGDTALEEALFLSKFADSVTVVHRRSELRASQIMQERAFAHPKLSFIWNSEVAELHGDTALTGLTLRNVHTGEQTDVDADGVFIAIGRDPRTALVAGQLDLTPEATIQVEGRSSRTSVPGIFAAGDVIDPSYRQAITAAASGCTAAIDVEHYLANAEQPLVPTLHVEDGMRL